MERFHKCGEKPVIAEKLGVTGSFYLRIRIYVGSFCPHIKSWLYLRNSRLDSGIRQRTFAGCAVAHCWLCCRLQREVVELQTLTSVQWWLLGRTSVNKLSSQIASERSSIVKAVTEVGDGLTRQIASGWERKAPINQDIPGYRIQVKIAIIHSKSG